MPARLPAVLGTDDLPEPELRAATLDGQLYAVGDSWRSIAEIDDHGGRAVAIGRSLGRCVVVAEASAAWVWGARGSAPLPHAGFVVSPARVKNRVRGAGVRQVVIDDDEIAIVHDVAVTTPSRTVVDLVRVDTWTPHLEAMARDVAKKHDVTRADVLEILDRRGRLPHRRRTLDRLEHLFEVGIDPPGTLDGEPRPSECCRGQINPR